MQRGFGNLRRAPGKLVISKDLTKKERAQTRPFIGSVSQFSLIANSAAPLHSPFAIGELLAFIGRYDWWQSDPLLTRQAPCPKSFPLTNQ